MSSILDKMLAMQRLLFFRPFVHSFHVQNSKHIYFLFKKLLFIERPEYSEYVIYDDYYLKTFR